MKTVIILFLCFIAFAVYSILSAIIESRKGKKNPSGAHKELYLFFDTETTGLPDDYDAPSNATDNWPRIVQLSWRLTDEEGILTSQGNYIIRPQGFSITTEATQLHGITDEMALKHGYGIEWVIDEFILDLDRADYIVGHNVEFDRKVVGAEMIRLGLRDAMKTKASYCTMMSTIGFCGLAFDNGDGYKYPKLEELYNILFDENLTDAHDASADVAATEKCFWALRSMGII